MIKNKSRVQVKCPKCDYIFLPSLKEKQSRAGKSARRKGANFEHRIAKQLSKWWNKNTNYEFKRTPMSGGSVLKHGWDLAGDICTNAPDFRLHLELKNQPSGFTGLHNWFSSKSKLWQWMYQAVTDCPSHRVAMLIFNRFDIPTFCAMFIMCDWIIPTLDKCGINYMNLKIHGSANIVIWSYKDMIESDSEYWR